MKHRVVLLLGSNIGNVRKNIEKALKKIESFILDLKKSSYYLTEPYGISEQPDFFNVAIVGYTMLSPTSLLDAVKDIERSMGREKNKKWHARIIDIDIIFFDQIIVNEPGLMIPHSEFRKRRFVLIPLCEIIPFYTDPVTGKSILEILSLCQDRLMVKKID